MFLDQDLLSLYDFLRSTPEGHLKKMMVGGKMSEAHLRVLLKVVRSCSNQEFIQYVQSSGLPKMKLSAAEMAVKEDLWDVSLNVCTQLGLLPKAAKAA
ncbi:MAG: hypothetical protein NDI61_04475 [Bdellovibrionaceae bacterium]|nr:hypothetical protein [Pseudobdellovibrionaceae bacterium]